MRSIIVGALAVAFATACAAHATHESGAAATPQTGTAAGPQSGAAATPQSDVAATPQSGAAATPQTGTAAGPLGIGDAATSEQIRALDTEIAPDGTNLPAGHGTAEDGSATYRARCASCHGERIAVDRFPYATTLVDYVARAMPPQAPRRLTGDELYAVIAYLLFADGKLGIHDVVDRSTIVDMQRR